MAVDFSRTFVAYSTVFAFLASVSIVLHGCGNEGALASVRGTCHDWCESDRFFEENGQKHEEWHCSGSMTDSCGGCSYCSGTVPTPRGAVPAPAPPGTGGSFTVVSYNMEWHKQGGTSGGSSVFGTLQRQLPFDVVGFQEMEDVNKVIRESSLAGFQGYDSAAGIAWNTGTFEKLGGPSKTKVGSDKWGSRYHSWVRLKHKSSGKNVLFTNTHGQWPRCPTEEGPKWVNVLETNSQPGDIVLMAGDWNCEFSFQALKTVMGYFNCNRNAPNFDRNQNPTCVASAPGHQSGIDHIFVKGGTIGQPFWFDGKPSDHNGVKGVVSW